MKTILSTLILYHLLAMPLAAGQATFINEEPAVSQYENGTFLSWTPGEKQNNSENPGSSSENSTKQDPVKAQSLYERAMTLRYAGRMTEAILAAKEILREHSSTPIAPRAAYLLATLLDETGQFEQALEIFDSMFQNSQPIDDPTRYFKLLSRMDRIKQHLEKTYSLSERFPESFYYMNHYIQLCTFLGETDRLIKFLISRLEKKPDDYFLEETLAKIYLDHGLFARAEELYGKLSKKYPSNRRFLVDLGNSAWGQGKTDEARLIWRSLISEPFRTENSYLELVHILTEKRLYNEALSTLEEAESLFNYPEQFFIEKARIYERLNDWEKAVSTYLDCIEKYDSLFPVVQSSLQTLLKEAPDALSPVTATLETRYRNLPLSSPLREKLVKLLLEIYLAGNHPEKALSLIKEEAGRNKETTGLFDFAKRAENMGFFEAALEAYKLYLERASDKQAALDASIYAARLLVRMKKNSEAFEILDRIKDTPASKDRSATIYNLLAELQLSTKGDIEAASGYARKSIELMPDENPAGYLLHGFSLYVSGQKKEAASIFKQLIDSQKPADLQVRPAAQFFNLLIQVSSGETDELELSFKRISGESPHSIYATKALELHKIMNSSKFELLKKYADSILLMEFELYGQASLILSELFETLKDRNDSGEFIENIIYSLILAYINLGKREEALSLISYFKNNFSKSRIYHRILLCEADLKLNFSDLKGSGMHDLKKDSGEITVVHSILKEIITGHPEAALSSYSRNLIKSTGGDTDIK